MTRLCAFNLVYCTNELISNGHSVFGGWKMCQDWLWRKIVARLKVICVCENILMEICKWLPSEIELNQSHNFLIVPNCSSITFHLTFKLIKNFLFSNDSLYSAHRLTGLQTTESAAYSNHKLMALLYLNSTQNTSVNWIIRLLLSLSCWSKVILLSDGHCMLSFCRTMWCDKCYRQHIVIRCCTRHYKSLPL